MGAIIATQHYTAFGPDAGDYYTIEEFEPDALGNLRKKSSRNIDVSPTAVADDGYYYESRTGRLLSSAGNAPLDPDGSLYDWPIFETAVFDRAGNRTLINRQSYNRPFPYRETTVSYYGADERLRVTDKRTGPGEQNTSRASAYEEYRYDALGRRILVRSRKASDCTHSQFCLSTIDRFVWDGDQLLYEIRYPGGDGVSNAHLERDTASIDVTGLPAPYGRVAYAHGLGIDRPLSIIRVNYGLSWYEPVAVFPHENWRGEFDIGTYDDGKVKRRDPQTLAEIVIDWPAENLSVFLSPRQAREPNSWFGSLLRNKRDGSELLYMRNRYYDAKQGRFTQEDPIGLAGGMNAYGFANGDPVNFSDPFGLCPSCVGAVGSVAAGWAIAELTGQDYTWKQAALDAAIGAAGVGLASKAGKLASLVR